MTDKPEVIEDAEFTEHGVIALRDEQPPERNSMTLFGTDDPSEVVVRATKVASALADVVRKQNLVNRISGKEYVKVEGWTLLGSMLSVFPVLETLEEAEVNGVKGFKATVAATTRDGAVVGRATAYCMRNESRWASADTYAVASMAQTRATSKALRAPLGFVMQLAGFEATPEAEIPPGGFDDKPTAQPDPAQVKPSMMLRLVKGLELLKGKPGWSEEEVVGTAAQTYKRQIKTLNDLTEAEALQIIDAMKTYGGVEV